ncbi:hypothetical protein [Emticicia sp. 21SJ11W-3]|uniref:hypothetical protein n=1 Tax=Emticicia sp. 21SJ11W-3 TaxID=2916755 RepID=UPI0020A21A83|nr:hypothetical protein [Emticicia sp. 21SJ11W-3]UTA67060.1 hypothetical protein MB380_15800 [Emticicia sp. 21SJ11W-3]
MFTLQERIEYAHQSLRVTLSHPLTIKVADELLKLDLIALVDHFKKEMHENFEHWYEKHEPRLKERNEKIGCVFFEHSYPYYAEDTRADAFGISSDSPRDEYGLYSHYDVMEDFEGSGEITLKTFKPLALFEEMPEERKDDNDFYSEKGYVLDTYYFVNSLIIGTAIKEIFYTSKFATICERPFFLEIQEHDMSTSHHVLAYLFSDRDEREDLKSFNYDLLNYEIETLFENAITHIKVLADPPPIYNIKFLISNYECSLLFEDKQSSDEEVKRLTPLSEGWIKFYQSEGNSYWENRSREELARLDRNYNSYNTKNSIFIENFSIFSIPKEHDSRFNQNYFLNDKEKLEIIGRMIDEAFKKNQSRLKGLNLDNDCILIAFGDDYLNRKTWKI